MRRTFGARRRCIKQVSDQAADSEQSNSHKGDETSNERSYTSDDYDGASKAIASAARPSIGAILDSIHGREEGAAEKRGDDARW